MEPTLRIKITLVDGTIFELEKGLAEARVFLRDAPENGFTDSRNGRFYSAGAIHTIEVEPPPAPLKFSDN